MLHNPHLGLTGTLKALYEPAKLMADCVVPQEYGITVAEKRSIGSEMCGALLEKIKCVLFCTGHNRFSSLSYHFLPCFV
jgi:inositol hexakisphosphate/diphosphoinositol-pentakisphosphate kinase